MLLRFISNATPLLRDAIFTPVSQQALARSAEETFGHALTLSLNFHQGKQTGMVARIIDRGRQLHRHPDAESWSSTSARRCSSWRWRPTS